MSERFAKRLKVICPGYLKKRKIWRQKDFICKPSVALLIEDFDTFLLMRVHKSHQIYCQNVL